MPDRSTMPPERQTEKSATKEVVCTTVGCGRRLIVNTFYAPAKALCSDCKGTGARAPSAAVRAAIAPPPPDVPAEPVRSLADLRCPFDDNPMVILRVDERMGWLTFQCQHCLTAVEIMPAWSAMLIKQCPEDLRPLVAEFNESQMLLALHLAKTGEIVRRNGISTRASVLWGGDISGLVDEEARP